MVIQMRLIIEDALAMVKFHGYPEIEITPSDVNAEAYKRGWNDAIDAIIESTPSIDAVKHGQWMFHGYRDLGTAYRCSECGFIHFAICGENTFNYCPSCGARMDGENNG